MKQVLTRATRMALFSGLLGLTSMAQAYDPLEAADDAVKHVPTLDCSRQQDQCRYYAALEYVAFARGCPAAYAKKFGHSPQSQQENSSRVETYIQNWAIFHDVGLKAAVLLPENKLRLRLEKVTADYLETLVSDDLGIECTRTAEIAAGKLPEYMSDILSPSKNYSAWTQMSPPADAAR